MASIFCDGACSGNGTSKAYGGWAWAFWPSAARGEPIFCGGGKLETVGQAATNQRAELMALLESLRWAAAHPNLSITIYTDSMYAINCTTTWGPGWKRKGWTRGSGEPLLNLDLIKPLVEIWQPRWPLQHVRGHQTGSGPAVYGNNWVDKAAVAAARGSPICRTGDVLLLDIPPSPSPSPSPSPPPKPEPKKVVAQADLRQWFS